MTEYKGYTGRIVVEPDTLVIFRDTLAAKTSHGGVDPWRIPLQAITGVKVEDAAFARKISRQDRLRSLNATDPIPDRGPARVHAAAMSKARLVISAVVIEKRPVGEVIADYGISKPWAVRAAGSLPEGRRGSVQPRSKYPKISPTALACGVPKRCRRA